MLQNRKNRPVLFGVLLACALQFAAFAAVTGLPWETPVGLISKSLTGPVALGIGLVSLIVIGAGVAFRPDWFELGSKMVLIPAILAILLTASGIVTTLFPGLVGAIV